MAYMAPNISLISPISTNSNGSAVWACGTCRTCVTDVDLDAYSRPVSGLTEKCAKCSDYNSNKTESVVEYWLCGCLEQNPIIEKKCAKCPRMKPSSSIPINYKKK